LNVIGDLVAAQVISAAEPVEATVVSASEEGAAMEAHPS